MNTTTTTTTTTTTATTDNDNDNDNDKEKKLKLKKLRDFVKSPSETATSKLFTILLADLATKSPRKFAFELDKYTTSAPENMQIYIDTMYNNAISNADEIAATTTLHLKIIPALFRAVEFNGNTATNTKDDDASGGKVQDGVMGANGVMYYPTQKNELKQEADPEVAHRLICALLRPPSTWLIDRRSVSSTTNTVHQSVWHTFTTAMSTVFIPERDSSQSNIQSDEPGSELRMKLLLEYARCTCVSFLAPAHGSTVANAYGAIIGSLQGTDEHSPEVAVVVACLNLLCNHLNSVHIRDVTVLTGLEVLTIALELVPSTALMAVWDMISTFISSRKEKETLIATLANNINQMEDGSRRSLVTRKLLQMYPMKNSKL